MSKPFESVESLNVRDEATSGAYVLYFCMAILSLAWFHDFFFNHVEPARNVVFFKVHPKTRHNDMYVTISHPLGRRCLMSNSPADIVKFIEESKLLMDDDYLYFVAFEASYQALALSDFLKSEMGILDNKAYRFIDLRALYNHLHDIPCNSTFTEMAANLEVYNARNNVYAYKRLFEKLVEDEHIDDIYESLMALD